MAGTLDDHDVVLSAVNREAARQIQCCREEWVVFRKLRARGVSSSAKQSIYDLTMKVTGGKA